MFQQYWAAILASKTAKIGAGVAAGGSSIALVLNMITARVDELNKKIDDKDKAIREYVDFRHDMVMNEIAHIGATTTEIKDTLKTMERRMYDEKRGK